MNIPPHVCQILLSKKPSYCYNSIKATFIAYTTNGSPFFHWINQTL